ncbi:MAG: Gfo/Idh/MocA family oxidoreductase [Isosphaeraceae bacterium]
MRESISIGLIGIGYGQHVHIPAFRSDGRCCIVGICASTADRAREVAARHAIPRAFGDWRELLADPLIDAVSIAVPPALQAPIVLSAAAAGKHVFCEKPVAPCVDQARKMLRAVEDACVVHAVDFIFPEIPAWQRARQILCSGELGSLRHVALSWRVETYSYRANRDSWKLHREEGGGALNNFASHSLYYLEWLFGPIERVAGRLAPKGAVGDARVDAWVDFAEGVPGSLSVAADAFLGSGHRLEVYGEQGTLVLENRSADHASGFVLAVGTRARGSLTPKLAEGPGDQGNDGRVAATAAIVRRFLDAITLGRRVTPSLTDGLRVQELIGAVRAADSGGCWQSV